MLVESTEISSTSRSPSAPTAVRGGQHRREHLLIGAIDRPAAMPLPDRLPGTELGRQIAPWSPGPEPPRDRLQRQPVIIPRTTPPASTRRHHRLLIVDLLHFARSASSIAELRDLPPKWFRFAHVCDAPAEIPTTREDLIHTARFERLFPRKAASISPPS